MWLEHNKSTIIILASFFLSSCSKEPSFSTQEVAIVSTESSRLKLDFIRTFGGNNIDEAVDMVESNDGNYIVVGTTRSTDGDIAGKSGDDQDYWVLKLSKDGDVIWERRYGGTNEEVARSISKTTDGGYIIAGQSNSSDGDVSKNEGFFDYWIVKITSNGDLQWEKNFGFSGRDIAYEAFQTNDGGYFIVGELDVTASEGEGNTGRSSRHAGGNFWGIKLANNGDFLWSRFFGGTFTDTPFSAIENDQGDFIIVGFSDSTDLDVTNNIGADDFWVVKISALGELIWQKNFGGTQIDIAYSITKSQDNTYIIVGETRSRDQDITNSIGNADVWITKITNQGDLLWQKSLGGTQFESARSIYPIGNGEYVISGNTRSNDGDVTFNKGQNDIWVVIINENGDLVFQNTFGGSGLDLANSGIVTNAGSVLVTGTTSSTDLDIPFNKGVNDIILIKLNVQ